MNKLLVALFGSGKNNQRIHPEIITYPPKNAPAPAPTSRPDPCAQIYARCKDPSAYIHMQG